VKFGQFLSELEGIVREIFAQRLWQCSPFWIKTQPICKPFHVWTRLQQNKETIKDC